MNNRQFNEFRIVASKLIKDYADDSHSGEKLNELDRQIAQLISEYAPQSEFKRRLSIQSADAALRAALAYYQTILSVV